MIKKLLLAMMAAMVITVAGCGNGSGETPAKSSEPVSASEDETAKEQGDIDGTIVELTKENWNTYYDLNIVEKYADDGVRVKYSLSIQLKDEYMDAYIAHCSEQFPKDMDWSRIPEDPGVLLIEISANSIGNVPCCIDLNYHVDYPGEAYFYGALKEDTTEFLTLAGGLSYSMDKVIIHDAAMRDEFLEANEAYNEYWKNTPALEYWITGSSYENGYYYVGIDPETVNTVVITEPVTIENIVIDEVQGSIMVWNE